MTLIRLLLRFVVSFMVSFSVWAQDSNVNCGSEPELCKEAAAVTKIVYEKKLQGQLEDLSYKDLSQIKKSIEGGFSVNREKLNESLSPAKRKTVLLESLMKSSGVPTEKLGTGRNLIERDLSRPSDSNSRSGRSQERSSTRVSGGFCGPEDSLCGDELNLDDSFWD